MGVLYHAAPDPVPGRRRAGARGVEPALGRCSAGSPPPLRCG